MLNKASPCMRRALPSVFSTLRCTTRSLMTPAEKAARYAKLKQIYAPFAKLEKDSPQYLELAHSGKVWEDYFRPYDTKPYKAIQQTSHDLLAEIDEWKEIMKPQIPHLAKTLVAEYAHQSVRIENNPLSIGEAVQVYDLLDKEVFGKVDLAGLSAESLLELPLPQYGQSPNLSSTNELKNHLVVSQWLAERAAAHPDTAGLSEKEVRQVNARLVRGTDSEKIYFFGWGGRVELGGYRRAPIQVASNPLEVFPYPQEISACIERFFKWRDAQHAKKDMHPLVLACHMTAYFVHIHPFPDGNGRSSRALMHDYMVRQGYLPVVFRDLDRRDYLRMIADCHAGNPEEFITTVLWTQVEELRAFYSFTNTKSGQ